MLIFVEIALGVVFWIRDAGVPLVHLEHTADAPYVYYGFASTSENGRNADGFLSDSPREKPEGVYRVAILGGSVAERLGSARDDDGELLLESELRRALGSDRVELVNAGMSGYVVEQEFILLQLVLQQYRPDLVFGLDGYNDLMSFKLNRYVSTRVPLPPQNYRDFLVISEGKRKSAFLSRFSSLFRHGMRALDFLARLSRGEHPYDFTNVGEEEYGAVSDAYVGIVGDTRDLAGAKGIRYVSFLQPVRYYRRDADGHLHSREEAPELARLYGSFEERLATLPYAHSLTHVFDGDREVYLDSCHVTREGNRILAREIAARLAPEIEADPDFRKLVD
jgi:lysophospholipase L1-like esterase